MLEIGKKYKYEGKDWAIVEVLTYGWDFAMRHKTVKFMTLDSSRKEIIGEEKEMPMDDVALQEHLFKPVL